MSSSYKEHRPKSAKAHPPKCQPTYVVAFSLNENEDTMKAVNDDKNLDATITYSTVVSSVRDPTNNTISSITSILNEIIDNMTVSNEDDKIKQSVTEYTIEKNLEENHQSNVLFNSNLGLGDISSSNTSTDTIRNTSDSSNLTICSNVGSLPTENSNTTLKHQQKHDDLYSNFIIPLTSKCTIFSAKNNEQLEEVNKIAKNSSISCNTAESLTINIPSGIHIQVSKSKSSLILDNVITPYKTDCINVALVQMERSPIVTCSKEKINSKVNENKSNSLILPKNIPNPTTDYSKSYLVSKMYNENENSETTLVGSVFSGFSSSNDERLHNTGSSINKTNDSMCSLTSRSQYYSSTDEKLEDSSVKPSPISNTIPTTSDVEYVIDTNHVIIADDMRKLYPLKSKGDGQQFMNKFTENLIKKTFDIKDNFQKNVTVTLPNESTIQEILTQRENVQKLSCSEESRNFQPFPDMWEKISLTLDIAIKRLEESLSDKILNELKTTLHKIEHFANQISLQKPNESGDVDAIEKGESNNDEGMQCNIIQSYVIDNLMIKLSEEDQSEGSARTKILKVKHPKMLADTFEVLKAYSKPVSIPTGEGDSLRVSSGESEISTQSRRRILFHGPLRFLRENSVVLGSVPAFFVYMLVIYGFVMLVVKV
ncbi:uncharacterized protein LOC125052746 isoform X2 [Pieris napi]|uniref:uncharacterized protein LOC125052746 isoform X2 n=1 Tax=Pieris napi TaxID=78633 RepID=UPI001FB9EEF2|nr:uncharacterized protein LOC125052746 isoform X2 [Pieris napi]